MLTVTGTAELIKNGEELRLEVRVQPATPQEHTELEKFAKCMPETPTMDRGNLVFRYEFPSAARTGQQPSALQSTATSAKTDARPFCILHGKMAGGLTFTKEAMDALQAIPPGTIAPKEGPQNPQGSTPELGPNNENLKDVYPEVVAWRRKRNSAKTDQQAAQEAKDAAQAKRINELQEMENQRPLTAEEQAEKDAILNDLVN